jgi:hypothetical protein
MDKRRMNGPPKVVEANIFELINEDMIDKTDLLPFPNEEEFEFQEQFQE